MIEKMAVLLIQVQKYLTSYLQVCLPKISNSWWESCVIQELSFNQKNELTRKNKNSLNSLDLPMLLRVFQKNSSQLSYILNLPNGMKTLIFDMIDIRNKYSHIDLSVNIDDDFLRDILTIEKFLKNLDVNDNHIVDLINSIKIEYKKMNSDNINLNKNDKSEHLYKPKNDTMQNPMFNFGDIVAIKSNPDKKVVVLEVIIDDKENIYKTFLDGDSQKFYESQLLKIENLESKVVGVSLNNFNAVLSSIQILNPNIKTLYSLNSAYIDFIPYQYRPVLKIIKSDKPRILIADEVGTGKTIEAGLILRELQARNNIKSVLVICPKPLITENKWKDELKRFNEDFRHINSSEFNLFINEFDKEGEIPENFQKIIVPYSIFSEELLDGNKKPYRIGLNNLLSLPQFDLVIVDEAHKIRNSNTITHKVVQKLCENAEAVVFLTATPIQLGENDLFTLLNVLRPDLFIDTKSYFMISEPNGFINNSVSIIRNHENNWQSNAIKELNNAKLTEWGKIVFTNHPDFDCVIESLSKPKIEQEERVLLIRQIENFHTLNNMISRTRRRDIGEFTSRNAKTVEIEFTQHQKELYEKILAFQINVLGKIHGSQNIKFMMSTILRQTSSSILGLIPYLKDILNRHLSEIDVDEIETDNFNDIDLDSLKEDFKGIMEFIENLDRSDPKIEELIRIIKEKEKLANKRLLIFSSFRHTVFYLNRKLNEAGIRNETIYGDVGDEDRVSIKERFSYPYEHDEAFEVLISSEVGSEGLDFQFCDAVVNYDIPWNPMRIEQRIGRIDRYGQESPVIAIYNFVTPGTVDYEIYTRCLLRIGIFEKAVGGCEVILGEIFKGINDIALDFKLSEKQKEERLQNLADNKVSELHEKEKIENEQYNLFSVNIPGDWIKDEIENASNYWLKPKSLQNLVELYLNERIKKNLLWDEKPIKKIKLTIEEKSELLKDFIAIKSESSPLSKAWEKLLRNTESMELTFDAGKIQGRRNITLMSPVHPLVRQAAYFFDKNQPVYTAIKVKSNKVKSGKYPFAIYLWDKQGIKKEVQIKPITIDGHLDTNFIELLKDAEDDFISDVATIDENKFDSIIQPVWQDKQNEHKEHNHRIIDLKIKALEFNHKNRVLALQNDLRNINNDKIFLMRESQIINLKRNFKEKISGLENMRDKADLYQKAIGYGIIEVESEI